MAKRFTDWEAPRERYSVYHEFGSRRSPLTEFFPDNTGQADGVRSRPGKLPPWREPWCAICRSWIPIVNVNAITKGRDIMVSVSCHGQMETTRISPAESEAIRGYGVAFDNAGANQW